jgi:hypothetical protein
MRTKRGLWPGESGFKRLKAAIDERFAPGRFVAVDDGAVIADAQDFEQLCGQLAQLGKDSPDVLVVQAGVEYPETAVIF